MTKFLTEITREEWICFNWLEATEMGSERTFMSVGRRTPDEAAQARDDWDSTIDERSLEDERKPA